MSFPESLITQDPGWFAFILGATLRVTLILAVAVIATRVLRKATARVRHAVLATAIVGVLAVPFLSQVLPGWGLGLIPTLPSAERPQSGAAAAAPVREAFVVSDARILRFSTTPENTGKGPVTDVLRMHPSASVVKLTPRGSEGMWVDLQGATPHRHVGESPASESVGTSATISTEIAVVEPVAFGSVRLIDSPLADSPTVAGRMNALKNGISEVSLLFWFLAVWLVGLCFFLASMIRGLRKADGLAADSVPVTGDWLAMVDECRAEAGFSRDVDVRMTQTVTAPMTWGARRPIVLLPDAAEEWSEECRRVVLRHEFAHIQRNDWLFHTLSRIACAVYWLNPLAWIATRRLSIERERACDDAVISLGTKPSEYAKHLVDIAQSMTTMRSVPAVALTMARLSQLEGRIIDVLRPTGKANRRAAWLGSIGMAGLLVAVTVVEPSGSTWGAKEESPRGHAVAPVADIRVVPHIVDVATEFARHVISVRPVIAPTVSVRTVFVPKLSYVPLPRLPMEYLSGTWAPTSNDDCSYYRVERDDDHMIFEMKNDDVDLYFETRGDVEFSDDGTAITKMGKRSKVVIESREGRDLFEIVIRPGDGDKLTYDWRVNDKKREFDRKGEEWLEMVLAIVHDHLAMTKAAGARNALLGEINAVYGERNVAQGLINTLLGERNVYEGEINRLMGNRNHQIDRLRMIESEKRDLMQKRREIEYRLQRGDNVTEDLDRTMLELIDEQLGELQKAKYRTLDRIQRDLI